MKTGRTATPAPASKETAIIEVSVQQDFSAANQLAVIARETDVRVRAVALSLGYQLPADCTDPNLIQRDISANMRRSVEACLEVGRGLRVLKEACDHGDFMSRIDALGIDPSVGRRFMEAAIKFTKRATSHVLTSAAGNQSKLFEMLVLDDDQLEELELIGQTGELSLDDVATMSVKELRAALREARQEKAAVDKVLTDKNASMDKLRAQVKRVQAAPPDEQLLLLQREATSIMNDALGAIRGNLRQALIALKNHGDDDNSLFAAGLVGQLQGDLAALREEFNLPDVSTAADTALAADVAQWAK